MDAYGMMFAAQAGSPTLRDIWRAAYQADSPADADPLSFVTQTDLDRIVDALALTPGMNLVDLACGAGGPGTQVARATGAR
jgi:cyclopropane fatty-acyl-phospholipid synthase-like methyltransferase